MSLSIMKVISGVFMHETFKVCGENDDLMIIQKKRTTAEYTKKMTKLFKRAAGDGGASITREQFEKLMQDQWIRTWLSAMEINVNNVERLWILLDDGDGRLTAEELVKGLARLKGGAKSIHVWGGKQWKYFSRLSFSDYRVFFCYLVLSFSDLQDVM